jgi:hypothetical protein
MKAIITLTLLTVFTGPVFAGPMVGGGPPPPQQQEASAFVDLDLDASNQPNPSDVKGCNSGTSVEAKVAMKLAVARAKKRSCIHGGHPSQVEPGQTTATETESFGWLCEAYATLPCR